MSKRISHSLLDPWLGPPIKRLYPVLRLPRSFPPEGIIAIGHLVAIGGAIGFAYSTQSVWGGIVAALGVTANHVADCLDGTHARTTGQCRNGGELLDHFTDPLSFAYWLIGIAVSVGRLDLGLVAVVCLFASAVLTNIKAKLTGEFTLSAFGPTEFKALLVVYALMLAMTHTAGFTSSLALGFYVALIVAGLLQLLVNLVAAVREVNAKGPPADITEWEVRGDEDS